MKVQHERNVREKDTHTRERERERKREGKGNTCVCVCMCVFCWSEELCERVVGTVRKMVKEEGESGARDNLVCDFFLPLMSHSV